MDDVPLTVASWHSVFEAPDNRHAWRQWLLQLSEKYSHSARGKIRQSYI